jgi:dipeptidyl aminopeptidase/acylaminoacyl peptidase
MRADEAGEPVRLLQSDVLQAAASISDDGTLLFTERQVETGVDVWTVRIELLPTGTPKAGRPSRIIRTQHPITNPRLSPDGRWLAYQSSESGSPHVYVLGLPDGGKWRISSDAVPASAPRWSRQDNRLFYRTPVGIMVVDYAVSGKTFIPQKGRLHLAHKAIPNSYDLRHDTQGIVFLQSDAPNSEPSNHVVLVLRFFDFLRNRLSTQ